MQCLTCGAAQPDIAAIACAVCAGPLGFTYKGGATPDPAHGRTMWRYRHWLPVPAGAEPVTLGEGGTPLLASRLSPRVRLWWKDETRNPTGSHKDRALALAMTHARLVGARLAVVVSAGSTGLANAAYAARAGIPSVTLVPQGAPEARLRPLAVYGSRLIEVAGGIDAVIDAARRLAGRNGIYVASTTRTSNPIQGEAAKTIAHEIADQFGDAPDWLIVPTGGGGTIAGLWRGFLEARDAGRIGRLPRLAAVVPSGYDALASALRDGVADAAGFAALPYRDDVPTILTKLSHAHPPDGLEALAAIRASGGTVVSVGDDAAAAGSERIARADGLYLEPSSGVLAPALDGLLARRLVGDGASVIGLACGSGFRETFVLADRAGLPVQWVTLGDLDEVLLRHDDPDAMPQP